MSMPKRSVEARGLLLNCNPCAFRDQDEVGKAVDDDRTLTLLYRIRKHCRYGWWGARITVRKDIDIGTFSPCDVHGCVNGFFDVLTVEIERRDLCLGERATANGRYL